MSPGVIEVRDSVIPCVQPPDPGPRAVPFNRVYGADRGCCARRLLLCVGRNVFQHTGWDVSKLERAEDRAGAREPGSCSGLALQRGSAALSGPLTPCVHAGRENP
jgi:hypothetical protein